MKPRIVIDPDIRFGKPCIDGTRIAVRDVLELVEDGLSYDKIVTDYYPELRHEDIQACVEWERDNEEPKKVREYNLRHTRT